MKNNQMVWIEQLNLGQRFRLIEIAHETGDSDIKRLAVGLLMSQERQMHAVPTSDSELR